MRSFEICYTLKNSNSTPMQRTIIQATDHFVARRIFEQQNPQCRMVGTPREIR